MTCFRVDACLFDPDGPARAQPGNIEGGVYGGEQAAFLVPADSLDAALRLWLARLVERGAQLHILLRCQRNAPGADPGATSVSLIESYGYPPLEDAAPKGVQVGLIAYDDQVREVLVRSDTTSEGLSHLLDHCAAQGLRLSGFDGFCDIALAEEDAEFDGKPLRLAALGVAMRPPGTIEFGATYPAES